MTDRSDSEDRGLGVPRFYLSGRGLDGWIGDQGAYLLRPPLRGLNESQGIAKFTVSTPPAAARVKRVARDSEVHGICSARRYAG